MEITFPLYSTGLEVKPTELFDPTHVPTNQIVYYNRGGSGFVLGTPQNTIKVSGCTVTGILATAAHCYGTPDIRKLNYASVVLLDDHGHRSASRETELLHYYASFAAQETLDPITRANYVLPQDLALALLYDTVDARKFVVGRPDQSVQIVVAGKPEDPVNFFYAAPALANRTTDLGAVRNSIMKAFHDFRHPVYSVGDIVNLSRDYLAPNCATCTGMSGSPIYRIDNKELVGMLLGGPMLPGMYEAYKLAAGVAVQLDAAKAAHLPIQLDPDLRAQEIALEATLRRIGHDGDAKYIHFLSMPQSYRDVEMLVETLRFVGNGIRTDAGRFEHNICLSVDSPVFQQAMSVINQLETMGSANYSTVEELRNALGFV